MLTRSLSTNNKSLNYTIRYFALTLLISCWLCGTQFDGSSNWLICVVWTVKYIIPTESIEGNIGKKETQVFCSLTLTLRKRL